MEANAAVKASVLSDIAKQSRSKSAKIHNWPGVPMGHYGCMGPETEALRDLIADGIVVIVERSSKTNPTRIAKFVRVA